MDEVTGTFGCLRTAFKMAQWKALQIMVTFGARK
jgi:hypothetical protein